MAKGKKAVPKKLEQQLRAAGVSRAFFNASLQRDMPRGIQSFDSLFEDNPLLLGSAAHAIGELNSKDASDAAILKAFEVAGLSPKNPFHWRAVMEAFCVHHFGKPKTKTVIWDHDAILKWYFDCEQIKAKNPSIKTDIDLAKHLSRHHPDYKGKYKTDKSVRHLTKRIEDAYDPTKNLRLRYPKMSDFDLMKHRAELEGKGVEWNLGQEKLFFEGTDRVKTQLDAMVKTAISQHPDFQRLLKEAVERAKQRVSSGQVSAAKAIQEAATAQSVQTFIDGVVEGLKQRLEGDASAGKEP